MLLSPLGLLLPFALLLASVAPAAAQTIPLHKSLTTKPSHSTAPPAPEAAAASAEQAAAPAPPPKPVTDPLGRTTPYGTVIGFLQAVSNNQLSSAVQYLDTKLPEKKAEELAVQLKTAMDASLSTSVERISRDPGGDTRDNLRLTREKIGTIRGQHGDLDLFLDRVQRNDGPSIWLFSSETLAQVPQVTAELPAKHLPDYLPASFNRITIGGVTLNRILLIFIALLGALALSSAATRLLLYLFELFFEKTKLQSNNEALRRLRQPIRLLMLAGAIAWLQTYSVSVLARRNWALLAQTLLILGIGWLLVRIADLVASAGTRRSLAAGVQDKIAVITLAQRLFKILAIFTVLLILLRQAGVDVSAMIAGLGIGGIALALAAQQTLADLFGGISIISRETIRVGDYCRIADQVGTVEDIGLSSTRLRTLDRTVVSIPNAKIAQAASENFTLRDNFWFHHFLLLRFDTPHAKVEDLLTAIKAAFDKDGNVDRTTSRVTLLSLDGASFRFELFAYINASTYNVFLGRQQDLLLRILDVIDASGARLAFPTQTLNLEPPAEAPPPPPSSGQ